MRIVSTLAGIFLLFLGTIGSFRLSGGNVDCLFMVVPFLGLILATLGSSILAYGVNDIKDALLASRFLVITHSKNGASPRSLAVVRYLIISNYAFGGLIFLFGSMITLSGIAGPVEAVGQHIAACICTFVYAILVAEVFLRPLRCRLEDTVAKQ